MVAGGLLAFVVTDSLVAAVFFGLNALVLSFTSPTSTQAARRPSQANEPEISRWSENVLIVLAVTMVVGGISTIEVAVALR